MNRLLFCAALCVFSLPGALLAGSLADLDRENGLPEAKIGTAIGAFTGLKLVEDTGRWLTYAPTSEKLKYAGFPATAMKFNFFKGKLYSINIELEGRRETRGVLKYLESAYGTTHSLEKHHVAKADFDLEVREWAGQKIYLLYKSASNFQGGEVTLLDRVNWDLLQIPREQRKQVYRAMMGGSFINGDFDTTAPKAAPDAKPDDGGAPGDAQ